MADAVGHVTIDPRYDIDAIEDAIRRELSEARRLHPRPLNSPHEGWAVLYEEVDELWEAVRMKAHGDQQERRNHMREELIQIGAMVVRMLQDVVDG